MGRATVTNPISHEQKREPTAASPRPAPPRPAPPAPPSPRRAATTTTTDQFSAMLRKLDADSLFAKSAPPYRTTGSFGRLLTRARGCDRDSTRVDGDSPDVGGRTNDARVNVTRAAVALVASRRSQRSSGGPSRDVYMTYAYIIMTVAAVERRTLS